MGFSMPEFFQGLMGGHASQITTNITSQNILSAEADKNRQKRSSWTSAIETGNLLRVQQLHEKEDIPVDFRNKLEQTGTMLAIANNQLEVFEYLIAKGADITAVDQNGHTVLLSVKSVEAIDKVLQAAKKQFNYDNTKLKSFINQGNTWNMTRYWFANRDNEVSIKQRLLIRCFCTKQKPCAAIKAFYEGFDERKEYGPSYR